MKGINTTYRNRVRFTLSHESFGSTEITEPEGWDEDEKEYARNENYHGIFTKFSNSLVFVEDGADYINSVRDIYGINAEIFLLKEHRHPHTDVWEESYSGVLDLSEWEEENFKVKVKFNSSGLETEIKARESEKVEIERETDFNENTLDPIQTHNVELDGRQIFLYSEFEADNATNTVTTDVFRRLNNNWGDASIPVPISLVSQNDPLLHNPIPSMYDGENVFTNKPDLSHTFFGINERDKTITYNFSGSFTVKNTGHARIGANAVVRLMLSVYGNGSNYDHKQDYILWNDPSPKDKYATKTATFNENIVLNLVEGDSLVLRYYTGADNGNATARGIFKHNFYDLNISMTTKEDSYYEKSSAKMILAHDFGDRLVEILTSRKDAFYSEYLGRQDLGYLTDGEAAYKGYSCGHWLRGFDKEPEDDDNRYKPFTTTLKDFLEDLMVTENVGIGIEKFGFKERLVVRPLEEFYPNYVTVKLPYQVSKVKRKVSKKHYYSSVKIGCAKGWENEEAMGLDEYNTQSNFTSPIVRIKNVFEKITKYIYAPYASEFIRRKPKSEYPTEDHSNDKEIFAFALKKEDEEYKLRKWQDDLEQEPTGVYSPDTAYNFKYSPVNILFRHGWVLATSFTKNLTNYLSFGSSEGNSSLKTKFIGQSERSENSDILCSDLGTPRYLPESVEFEHIFDYDIKEQIEGKTIINGKEILNIYGLIEFINEKGEKERGRLQSLKPNGAGKWTLLKAS